MPTYRINGTFINKLGQKQGFEAIFHGKKMGKYRPHIGAKEQARWQARGAQ